MLNKSFRVNFFHFNFFSEKQQKKGGDFLGLDQNLSWSAPKHTTKPPWFNKNIINLIKTTNIFYNLILQMKIVPKKKKAIKALQNKLTSTIENAKSELPIGPS